VYVAGSVVRHSIRGGATSPAQTAFWAPHFHAVALRPARHFTNVAFENVLSAVPQKNKLKCHGCGFFI
jgi:hypothetical protein